MSQEQDSRGKVVEKLTSQKETLNIARYFARNEVTRTETVFGVIAAIILYGVGLAFGLYLLVNLFLQWG